MLDLTGYLEVFPGVGVRVSQPPLPTEPPQTKGRSGLRRPSPEHAVHHPDYLEAITSFVVGAISLEV
jgi:hypothetical protein